MLDKNWYTVYGILNFFRLIRLPSTKYKYMSFEESWQFGKNEGLPSERKKWLKYLSAGIGFPKSSKGSSKSMKRRYGWKSVIRPGTFS